MTKFGLIGHSGSYNRGCEAIVRCTMNLILESIPDATFNLVSYYPETDQRPLSDFTSRGVLRISEPVKIYLSPKTAAGVWDRVRRMAAPGFPSRVTFAHRAMVQESSVVLIVGGDTFTDEFSSPSPRFRDLAYARRSGKKTVIWAASIGPFHDPVAEKKYAEALKTVDLITARDSETMDYLKGLGVEANVVRVADPAFTLEVKPVANLPFQRGEGRTVVGLGLSALATGRYENAAAYLDGFVSLGNALLEDAGTWVVLVPHVTGKADQAGADESVCRAAYERLSPKERVYMADPGFDTREMKYVISQCDYFLGSRTHSTIAAFSTMVPTVSIGSTQKVYGINRDLFGHTEYVLPVEEVSAETLRSRYDHLRATADAARASLAREIPRHQAMARAGVAALCERLGVAACR